MKKVLLFIAVAVLLTGCSVNDKQAEIQPNDEGDQNDYSCIASIRVNEEEQKEEIVLVCPEGEELVITGANLKNNELGEQDFYLSNEPSVYFNRFVAFEKTYSKMKFLYVYDRSTETTFPFVEADYYGFLGEGQVFYVCANNPDLNTNYCRAFYNGDLSKPVVSREGSIVSYELDEDENLVITYLKPGAEEVEIEKIDLKVLY